jgi:hypothetical protein
VRRVHSTAEAVASWVALCYQLSWLNIGLCLTRHITWRLDIPDKMVPFDIKKPSYLCSAFYLSSRSASVFCTLDIYCEHLHIMAVLARLLVLFPMVFSATSAVLAALVLFAGHKRGFMEDYAIARVSASSFKN